MGMFKKQDEKPESVIESAASRSAMELAAFMKDPDVFKDLQKSSEDLFRLDDPNVELNREMVKMGLAVGEYIDMLPQVTNLDHPVHAKGLSHDMTELEIMRMLGLSSSVYAAVLGRDKPLSGFFGHLKARMGIVYPGFGVEIHPRAQLFGCMGKKDSKSDSQGIKSRIASFFQ